jgi:hypothetical protein
MVLEALIKVTVYHGVGKVNARRWRADDFFSGEVSDYDITH